MVSAPKSPEYEAWVQMRSRCTNPNHHAFARYGGRGIAICDEWDSFDDFFADMGARPSPLHSLDRYPDNDGNYEPDNCRWATSAEQMRNRSTVKLSDDAAAVIRAMLAQGWLQREVALEFGVNRSLISMIKSGKRWADPAPQT